VKIAKTQNLTLPSNSSFLFSPRHIHLNMQKAKRAQVEEPMELEGTGPMALSKLKVSRT
jgi:hypothetical protein